MFWDPENSDALHQLETTASANRAVRFHPDGKWIAVGSDNSSVRIFHTASGELVHDFHGHRTRVHCLSFNLRYANGDSRYDQTIRVWDTQKESYKYALVGHTNAILSLAFIQMSRFLSVAAWMKPLSCGTW